MTSGDKPQYISQSHLARHLNVSRTTIANWLTRWPCDDPVLPTPEPDAFVEGRPLWLPEAIPEWERWREQHLHRSSNRVNHSNRKKSKVKLNATKKFVVGISDAEAAENRQALARLLRDLHAKAGWPLPADLAARTDMNATTIRTALKGDKLPDRPTVVTLTKALGGDPEITADLWARSRPARQIDGGWLSRVLSVAHGQVLQMAASGATAESTAEAMGWTVEGVLAHWGDITERLRVQSMEEAVRVAVAAGYLETNADGAITLSAQRSGKPRQGGKHGYLIHKVAHDIKVKFADADPGTPLGTIDHLRAEFETSGTTIGHAVKILKAEGFIAGGGKGHPLIVADR